MTKQARDRLWLCIIGLVIVVIFVSLGVSQLNTARALMTNGAACPATITRKDFTSGRSTHYYVVYRYSVGGKEYRHTSNVSYREYRAAFAGKPVTIS